MMTGELLACSLAIGYPFYTQSVSLLGYSLGCQVTKSTLKTLHALEAHNVVQNVTFMAAAVDIFDKPKIEQRWVSLFSQTISGTITNAYSKSDAILLFYSTSQWDWALGRSPVFSKKAIVRKNLLANLETEETCVAGKDELVFRLTNRNANECKSLLLGFGHFEYRSHLQLILTFIDFRE